MQGDRVRARSRRRDLPENGRARVHEVEVVGWQVAGGAHPACAKGREARADASRRRNSNAVDAASRDPEANRCDGVRRVSSTRKTQRFDSRVARHVRNHTAPGVSGSSSPFTLTGGRGGGSRPPGWRFGRRSKGRRSDQRSSGVGAATIVPEGDASETRTGNGGGSTLETSEAGRIRKRLFQPTRRGGSVRKREQARVGGRSAEAGGGE